MKITYFLTPEDCIAARWAMLKPRPGFRLLGWLLVFTYVVVLGMAVYRYVTYGKDLPHLLILLGAGAYLGCIFFVLMPRRIRKVFAEQKSLRETIELELTDEKLAGSCASGNFSIAWQDVFKWKHTKTVVLIYESSAFARVIPMRVLNEAECVQLLTLLETHLGPPKV